MHTRALFEASKFGNFKISKLSERRFVPERASFSGRISDWNF